MAGTVSSSALDEQVQQQLSNTAAAHRREQEEREQVAREELARETEARRQAQEEEERKRREEEERFHRVKEERDEIERKQHEKLERMAVQAKELEDRLERLATSMPPLTTVDDPEATRVQENVVLPQMGNSFPGVQPLKGQPVVIQIPKKGKGNSILWLVAGAVALLVIVAGLGGYFILRPKPTPIVQNPPKITTPTIKAELLPIDGGTFQMGRDNGPPQETPAHPIKIQSFLMDKTEVTNVEYADFVRETNHTPPAHWAGPKPPFGQELWPVVNVSVDDVNTFAGWRSKRDGIGYRLPTEEEWEYAARNGENSDLYPWGKDWEAKLAVIKEATPSQVGSRPAGKNRWGVVDLIGNVWEWTSSKVSAYPGNPVKIPASTQEWVTIRGGCYVSDPENKDNPVSSCMRQFVPPTTKTPLLGFRLVRSAS